VEVFRSAFFVSIPHHRPTILRLGHTFLGADGVLEVPKALDLMLCDLFINPHQHLSTQIIIIFAPL